MLMIDGNSAPLPRSLRSLTFILFSIEEESDAIN